MLVRVPTPALRDALTQVRRAISRRSTLPILSHVHIDATLYGTVTITATNLDLTIRATLSTVGEQELGSTTVLAQLLFDAVKSIKSPQVTISADADERVTIDDGGTIQGQAAADFPPVLVHEDGPELLVDADDLKRAIASTAVAASSDEARPVLTGILLQHQGTALRMVATDGHRLAVSCVHGVATGEFADVIVPAAFLTLLAKSLKGAMTIRLHTGRYLVRAFVPTTSPAGPAFEFGMRIIEGTYPQYEAVIPDGDQAVGRIVASAADLIAATEQVAPFAKDAANVTRIESDNNGAVTISASTAEVGSRAVRVTGNVTLPTDFAIAFNNRYLADALKAIGTETIELSFTSALAPLRLQPALAERNGYAHIIMPIRVPS